jgi:short-subunit dehydrogenase
VDGIVGNNTGNSILDNLQGDQVRSELLHAHPGITVAVAELDVNEHDQVFAVFRRFRDELGGLDRVIVNAGVGEGRSIGTGGFDGNLRIANTNFVAALAQCEAAMEIFCAQKRGHLVVISSIAAMRDLPGNLSSYFASKAAVAALTEGIRADVLGSGIAVTTVYPGYVATDMTASQGRTSPLMVSAEKGAQAMVRAIESETAQAKVPAWPWIPVGFAMRHLPLALVAKLGR